MIEGLSRICYEPTLNRPIDSRRKVKEFYNNLSLNWIFDFLNMTLSEIISEDGSDVRLTACLYDGYNIEELPSGIIVFPCEGKVKQYIPNLKGNFFSDIHRNRDVTHIEQFNPITLDRTIKKNSIHFNLSKGESYSSQREYVPNLIHRGILLKKPIKEHTFFEKYLTNT